MIRTINHFLHQGITAVLIATLITGLSAKEEMPLEVIGPDGKPVEKATFHLVWSKFENNQTTRGVDQIDLADWKRGIGFDTQENQRRTDFFILESPGCALGIYQFGASAFKLEKEFWVEGMVIDEAGKPVPDVELTLGKFGLYTYTNIRLDLMAGKLPWVQTKTDKDGKYRLRGAVLDNYDWDVGVEVSARITRNGSRMVGESGVSFVSDSSFFDKARKDKSFEGGEVITMLPCDEITGVVLDAVTGKPVERVLIQAKGLNYDTHEDPHFFTDKDGRFTISGIRVGMLGADHSDYLQGNLMPEDGWREAKHNKLEIKLLPLVDTTIQFVDSHSDKAPLVPMEFSYEVKLPAGAGWEFHKGSYDSCGAVFRQEPQEVGPNGVFAGKLPSGSFQFDCGMVYRNKENSPYSRQVTLDIPLKGESKFKVLLDRKPGLLFSFNTPIQNISGAGDDVSNELSGDVKVGEDSSRHRVTLTDDFHFEPTSTWKEEANLQIENWNGKSTQILMDRDFIANPDSWPVKIDVAALSKKIKKGR